VLPRETPGWRRSAGIAARALIAWIADSRRIGLALAAAVVMLLLASAGCGGDDDGLAEGPAPAPAPGEAALTVILLPEGPDGPSRSAEVICPPDSPEGEEECEALDAIDPGAADPVPPGTACTQIYGGPDVVRLEGTLHGAEIDAELTRENGCEINRFDRFMPLLEVLFPNYEPGRALRP
jgi:hypothetical protein